MAEFASTAAKVAPAPHAVLRAQPPQHKRDASLALQDVYLGPVAGPTSDDDWDAQQQYFGVGGAAGGVVMLARQNKNIGASVAVGDGAFPRIIFDPASVTPGDALVAMRLGCMGDGRFLGDSVAVKSWLDRCVLLTSFGAADRQAVEAGIPTAQIPSLGCFMRSTWNTSPARAMASVSGSTVFDAAGATRASAKRSGVYTVHQLRSKDIDVALRNLIGVFNCLYGPRHELATAFNELLEGNVLSDTYYAAFSELLHTAFATKGIVVNEATITAHVVWAFDTAYASWFGDTRKKLERQFHLGVNRRPNGSFACGDAELSAFDRFLPITPGPLTLPPHLAPVQDRPAQAQHVAGNRGGHGAPRHAATGTGSGGGTAAPAAALLPPKPTDHPAIAAVKAAGAKSAAHAMSINSDAGRLTFKGHPVCLRQALFGNHAGRGCAGPESGCTRHHLRPSETPVASAPGSA
jgi:hypothetical protein